MAAVFLTGFASPTGAQLVEQLLQRCPSDVPIYCLVQIALRRRAEERLAQIERAHPVYAGRVRVLEGAVTLPDLGLGGSYERIGSNITEVFHLAAVEERRKERDIATKVNLIGAQNLLTFAERCPQLTRFHYVSSCLVSGAHAGVFSESDLDRGQSFRHHHEETLFLAELEVQRAREAGMPVTVYRPGRVTGDSATGAFGPDDALYDLFLWLLSRPSVDVPVLTGSPYRVRINIVPRDYAAAATAHLSRLEHSAGKVYHLVDPNPARIPEFARILGEVTGRRLVRVWAPSSLARPLLHVHPDVLSYLYQSASFTCTQALADLSGSGIACPPLSTYAGRLVDHLLAHIENNR